MSQSIYDGATDVVLSVFATRGGRMYLERSADVTPRGRQLLELAQSKERSSKPITEVFPWWSSMDA